MSEAKELIVYLTSQCNKRCEHFYISLDRRTNNPLLLSLDDLGWIYDNIKAKKVIFLGGEPLLYPHLEEALRLFSDSLITISTNSTLVRKNIKLLKKANIEAIQLSIEGGEEETNYLRGKNMWNTVLDTAKFLKKNNLNPYLRASFWLGNYTNLKEVFDAGESLDIPVALFPRVDKPPLPPNLTRDLFEVCLSKKNCIVAMPNFFQYLGKKGRCGAGEERINVFYDKRITPCNMDLDYTLGRIGDDTDSIKENMEIFVKNFKTIPVECAGCKNASVCKGSCYVARAWLGCPLRYNVNVDSFIQHYNLNKEKVYEKAEILTDFMRRVLVC